MSLHLYVEDVDARFRQAIAAGAKETRAGKDQSWTFRSEWPAGKRYSVCPYRAGSRWV